MSDEGTPHRRRPRYAGTHPRRFEEKYKERSPERYPEEVARIVASGKTPAGSHRPILVNEILDLFAPRPGDTAVDATLGAGGHALAILQRIAGERQGGGRLIGIDADPIELPRTEARIRTAGFGPERFTAVHSNLAALPAVLATHGVVGGKADIVIADLGCSSMQLDDPARGFSYKLDGPLDLRMNPQRGEPASALLRRLDAREIEALLRDNADEPRAGGIARAIAGAGPLARTSELARVVRAAVATRGGDRDDVNATLARVFQALRIEVNGELSALEAFLRALPSCLAPGGRVAILTFHSGEDRRVKSAFREGVRDGTYSDAARDVVCPSRAEIRANPRASSAKLRWAVRAAQGAGPDAERAEESARPSAS